MDLFVSRGACPVDSALRRNLGISAGVSASFRPHSRARDAFIVAIHESPSPINVSMYTQLPFPVSIRSRYRTSCLLGRFV